jgi:DNA-binding NtrC family response regulator
VDDQAVIRCALAEELALDGYEVAQAENATEAIIMICSGGTYELVLTDIDMPGPFNGIHLAEFTKYVSPSTRVIVMSGASHAVDHLSSIDLFVRKPAPSSELRRQVANLFGA